VIIFGRSNQILFGQQIHSHIYSTVALGSREETNNQITSLLDQFGNGLFSKINPSNERKALELHTTVVIMLLV
jgi:hypothetical protein